MKELEFLPEWYREGRRRQSHMRKQYLALVVIFWGMMTFNLTATHRASRAAAELARLVDRRVQAEGVLYEFNLVTRELNELKGRADSIGRIDSKIDVAAALAEMSHIISPAIVLTRVELIAEPFQPGQKKEEAKGAAVRIVGTTAAPAKKAVLDKVRFRIVLAGVAADPSLVADLVCKLEESPYFQHVYPSFSRGTKIQFDEGTAGAQGDKITAKQMETLDVTEFEITCYLANYEEIEK